MVNEPARMGAYTLLPGTIVSGFDCGAYYTSLELDKKLFQITAWRFARTIKPVTHELFRIIIFVCSKAFGSPGFQSMSI
jgi:hypothetical protein